MRLWFNSDPAAPDADPGVHENAITLSEAFHEEIDQHRIPVEREAIACFAQAPGTLDFCVWLVRKGWTLNGTQARVPLFGLHGLSRQ
ncbi:MAG: replication protein RepA [Terriglobia bacterium]